MNSTKKDTLTIMKKEQSMLFINGRSLFPSVNDVLLAVANAYSAILDEEVSTQKAARILNAQAAFVCLLLSGCASIVLPMLSALWLALALLWCRDAE